jgi:hypothetical protein
MDVIVLKAFDNPDSTGYITLHTELGIAFAASLRSQPTYVVFLC